MNLKKIAIPSGMQTRFFFMGEHVIPEVPGALQEAFPGQNRVWIVADDNTLRAAGEALAGVLKNAGFTVLTPYVFPGHPVMHASEELAQKLVAAMPENCLPLAVGSGTVNDLVKRASGLRGVPYCCFATACSVDGYTSKGAALLVEGLKKTMPCPPPFAVIADMEILRTAPPEMFAAGYADLLAKVYGGADWMIADEIGWEKIDPVPWNLVQRDLRDWLNDGGNLAHIFHGLCNTGYAMQLYHDSRPASGAEHMFSHVWEMEDLQWNGEKVSHGFQVAIGMLLSAQLMGFVVRNDVDTVRKAAIAPLDRAGRLEEIGRLLSGGCYGSTAETAMKKFMEGKELQERRELIWDHWEALRKRIREQYMPIEELREKLQKAHCPSHHYDVGMSDEQFLHVVPTAQLIRVRYTILDLLYESGLMDRAISEIDLD